LKAVKNLIELRSFLNSSSPDIVILDSELDWVDPIEAIHYLNDHFSAPTVLLCQGRPQTRQNTHLLKRAYSAGLQDALFSPLDLHELGELLSVLLRLGKKS
jgi:AmiR/NasT family two-component response regulator